MSRRSLRRPNDATGSGAPPAELLRSRFVWPERPREIMCLTPARSERVTPPSDIDLPSCHAIVQPEDPKIVVETTINWLQLLQLVRVSDPAHRQVMRPEDSRNLKTGDDMLARSTLRSLRCAVTGSQLSPLCGSRYSSTRSAHALKHRNARDLRMYLIGERLCNA